MPTRKLPFLCFKLSVLDFWDSYIGCDGSNDNLLIALKVFEIFMKVMDVINLVLDAIFVRKLFSLDQETEIFYAPVGAPAMLAALCATSNIVAIAGPLILRKINGYNPNCFDLTWVNMFQNLCNSYFAHWALMESSAFLLKDATTIYLYYFNQASLDVFNVVDTANIAASFVSGIVSCFVFCYTIISFTCGTSEMKQWLPIAFFIVALTIYSVYIATFCLYGNLCEYKGSDEIDPNSMEDYYSSVLPQLAVLATYCIGGFCQLFIITAVPQFYLCPNSCIHWPTPNGLDFEGNLPLACDDSRAEHESAP